MASLAASSALIPMGPMSYFPALSLMPAFLSTGLSMDGSPGDGQRDFAHRRRSTGETVGSIEQAQHVPSAHAGLGGLGEHRLAAGRPARRTGEHRTSRQLAGHPRRLVGHPA